ETHQSELELAYDANTRYSRRIRLAVEPLADLVEFVKQHPARGELPKRTLVYATTFGRHPADPIYTTVRNELVQLMGISEPDLSMPMKGTIPAGYIDVRWNKTDDEQLEKWRRDGILDKI